MTDKDLSPTLSRFFAPSCPTCDDVGRRSLAQEIREALRQRGHWAPPNAADLINAVCIALDKHHATD